MYTYMCIYTYNAYKCVAVWLPAQREHVHGRIRPAREDFSGPKTGKRKRVARKACRMHEKLTLLVTHFSLPTLAYPFQSH